MQNSIVILVPRYFMRNHITPLGGNLPTVWEPLPQSFQQEGLRLRGVA